MEDGRNERVGIAVILAEIGRNKIFVGLSADWRIYTYKDAFRASSYKIVELSQYTDKHPNTPPFKKDRPH